jgi:Fic family protein
VGHGQAYDFMFTLIGERRITVEDIKTMHRLFYKSIDELNAGTWRKESVIVSGTEYVLPRPQEIEGQMRKLEKWVKVERKNYHPVTFAALLHLKFVSIHPFIDGNGRTSRLIMNLALIQDGYQLAIIPPVLRPEYYDTIRQYQNKGKSEPFCEFIAERVYETQKEIMRLLHIPLPDMK